MLYLVVFLNKVDVVDDLELLELVEFEVRELFMSYGFFGDDLLVVQGLVLKVLEEDEVWEVKILELMEVVDSYILVLE